MPKRTNDFQKLVYIIKSMFAGSETVTESKELQDKASATLTREVDICIEGGETARICIECRDHKRDEQDVAWIDQVIGKYSTLAVNGVVLASRSGFTPEAKKRAKYHNIQLIDFKDLDTADFEKLLGTGNQLGMQSVTLDPKKLTVQLESDTNFPNEDKIPAINEHNVYTGDGKYLGSIKDFIGSLIESPGFQEKMFQQEGKDAKYFTFEADLSKEKKHEPVYVRHEKTGKFRKIIGIFMEGNCEIKIEKFGLEYGKMDDVTLAWGKTNIFGKGAYVVATKDAQGNHKIGLHLEAKKKK